MNRKTCLLQLILGLILITVVAGVVRRVVFQRSEPEVEASAQQDEGNVIDWLKKAIEFVRPSEEEEQPVEASVQLAAAPSPTLTVLTAPSGMPEMTLRLSRPMMFELQPAQGLAARDSSLYLATNTMQDHQAYVYHLDADKLTILQMRSLAGSERWQIGGLHCGSDLLWACLSSPKQGVGSQILGLSPATLDVTVAWADPGRITAVAQRDDGTVFGYCSETQTLVGWSLEGQRLASHAVASGAEYTDMDCLGQSLVCAGTQYAGGALSGVIDVIDTNTLSLLKRYPFHGMGADGSPLTAHGMTLTADGLMLAEWRNERVQFLTYAPVDGSTLPSIFFSVEP